MTSRKILKVLRVGKGQRMELTVDESEPEDSINRFWNDTFSDGEEALEIPPHWHKDHTEHFSVIEGRLEVILDGKNFILKAGDPTLVLPPRAVHSMKAFKGEKVLFREQVDPPGLYKALFFNDLLSSGGFGGIVHILRAFYDGDCYLALPFGSQFIDQMFSYTFGGLAHLFTSKKPQNL